MLFVPIPDDPLEHLAARLRLAENPTADLVGAIVAAACPRSRMLNGTGAAAGRLETLTKSAAWTDLALALIGFELPGWSLRRMVFEDGAWLCSLSSQPGLPLELDDTADASHESLPLALLAALIEVRRKKRRSGKRAERGRTACRAAGRSEFGPRAMLRQFRLTFESALRIVAAIAFCAMLAAIFWRAATMPAYTAPMKSQVMSSRFHMQP